MECTVSTRQGVKYAEEEKEVMSVLTAELPPSSQSTFPMSRGLRGAYHAYWLLYLAFVAAPIVAGLDKFADVLVDWEQYLTPPVAHMLPVAPHTFMQGVGVIEIFAGLLVAFRPAIGGYVVAFWLWGIIANLLLGAGYYDIALRDFGLSLAALALARLSVMFGRS
jgi:hypothetical protein